MAHRRREFYEDRGARISILAGISPRPDTLAQTAHARPKNSLADGAGHTFLSVPARRPFRPAPCPCGAAPAQVPSPGGGLVGLRRHSQLAARRGRRSRPASRSPAPPDTGLARGTRRCDWPRPSPPSRSPLPIAPSPSSADCPPSVPWPRRPRANAPASPRSLPPRVRQHQPPNSPAATTARRSGLCTLVRIGPTFLTYAPWVSILSERQLL